VFHTVSRSAETELVSALTCFSSAHSAGAGGAKGESPIYVSSYRLICVLILLYCIYMPLQLAEERRRRTVLKCPLPTMCPHTVICVLAQLSVCVSLYCYICVLILLHMCPHATTCVSSYQLISLLATEHFFCLLASIFFSSQKYAREHIF
jgi:hypothetical protein